MSDYMIHMIFIAIMPIIIEALLRIIGEIKAFISRYIIPEKGLIINVEYILFNGYWNQSNNDGSHTIYDALVKYINDHNIDMDYSTCDLDIDESIHCYRERMRNAKIIGIPLGVIKMKDITMTFVDIKSKVDNGSDQRNVITVSEKRLIKCHITSPRGMRHIMKFVNKCYNYSSDNMVNNVTKQCVFVQVPSETIILLFGQYIFESHITFDSIFFPQKMELIQSLNNYMDGHLRARKISLLLYGIPGCGKSSIIKAIAKYTGYSIIIIKLSYMKNDTDLLNIFYDTNIMCSHGKQAYIPLSRRIYVIEDIDAETDIVKARTDDLSPSTEDKLLVGINKIIESNNKKKHQDKMISLNDDKSNITLSGLLNAIDGVLEFNSILIVTTNHPEKLDPAFIRYGRFTMKIEMKRMTADDAHSLIKYYYPEYNNEFILKDNFITPAALASYIMSNNNLLQLENAINEHSPDYI